MTLFIDLPNYQKLLQTADTLMGSQGFYGRLYRDLINMSEDEIEKLNDLDDFKSCKNTLDVVMALEC